jgi:hypothetical protein
VYDPFGQTIDPDTWAIGTTARSLNSRGYASFFAITDSNPRTLQSDARCPGNSGQVNVPTKPSQQLLDFMNQPGTNRVLTWMDY